ncbi:hypothetical protein D6C97_01955 [Aureobasidium pullulans]|nr:hypothetical protein D6C97_01955 [Aureobasidium pullulans]
MFDLLSVAEQKELPAIPRPSRPRHLRLSHSVLTTIWESSADENKARWSIRPVAQDDEKCDEDAPINIQSPDQGEEERQSLDSQTSSPSSKPKTSFISTDPTSVCESERSKSTAKAPDYINAYTAYRLLSLKSRKQTGANSLRATLDKTQFLTNQLHTSMQPFNLLNRILNQLPGTSTALEDLREQTATRHAAITQKTDEHRLGIRNILKANYSIIAECEALLKEEATSNLELFTLERLAVNRLLTTFSSSETTKVEKDEDLESQQDVLVRFNEYVGSLIQSLDNQNTELEGLIQDLNKHVRQLEEEIHSYVRDKRSLSKMFRKMF